jgi:fluoroacetyl-CoA thioesterase
MKSGIESAVGYVPVEVTSEMSATLDGRELHPVYSTFWAGYHCEVAARRAIEPYFEEGEDAVGSGLSLRHMAMAGIGARLNVTARVTGIHGNRITCVVEIRTNESNILLVEGTQEQVVLSISRLQMLIEQAAIT